MPPGRKKPPAKQLPAKFKEPTELPLAWVRPEPDLIINLAATGMSDLDIALFLGANERLLQKRIEEDPEFGELISKGRAQGIEQVKRAVFGKAITGDIAAARLYLEFTGSIAKKGTGVQVTNQQVNVNPTQIVCPPKLGPAEFEKFLEDQKKKMRAAKAEVVIDAEVS